MSLWPFSQEHHYDNMPKDDGSRLVTLIHHVAQFQEQRSKNGVKDALFMVFLKGVRMKELQRQNWHVLAALEAYSPSMTRIHGSSVVAVKIC